MIFLDFLLIFNDFQCFSQRFDPGVDTFPLAPGATYTLSICCFTSVLSSTLNFRPFSANFVPSKNYFSCKIRITPLRMCVDIRIPPYGSRHSYPPLRMASFVSSLTDGVIRVKIKLPRFCVQLTFLLGDLRAALQIWELRERADCTNFLVDFGPNIWPDFLKKISPHFRGIKFGYFLGTGGGEYHQVFWCPNLPGVVKLAN